MKTKRLFTEMIKTQNYLMNLSKLNSMKTSIFHKISLYIWVLISFICLSSLTQDSIPKPHKKALDKMLNAYQKELIRMIPILVKKPSVQKETTFISTFLRQIV